MALEASLYGQHVQPSSSKQASQARNSVHGQPILISHEWHWGADKVLHVLSPAAQGLRKLFFILAVH